jgi:hypothetical protein
MAWLDAGHSAALIGRHPAHTALSGLHDTTQENGAAAIHTRRKSVSSYKTNWIWFYLQACHALLLREAFIGFASDQIRSSRG